MTTDKPLEFDIPTVTPEHPDELRLAIASVLGELSGLASTSWDPRPTGEFISRPVVDAVQSAVDAIAGLIDGYLPPSASPTEPYMAERLAALIRRVNNEWEDQGHVYPVPAGVLGARLDERGVTYAPQAVYDAHQSNALPDWSVLRKAHLKDDTVVNTWLYEKTPMLGWITDEGNPVAASELPYPLVVLARGIQ